jgi:UDP-3-O-[3-hydroxymyristoyl] glucosamine N-acyltransferase
MEFTLKQVADILQGIVEGNPDDKVWTLSKIEEGSLGSVSFLANPQYTPHLYTTKATAVIVANDFKPEKDFNCSLIRVADPYKAFAMLLEAYNRFKNDKKGIEQPSFVANDVVLSNDVYVGAFAYIGSGAKIGSNVKIYPHAFIGNDVIIGNNSVIHSGVKIYAGMIIGNNCIIHAGTVIGSDGFGFAPNQGEAFKKVPQIGNVIIEDEVEIGANTCIDRATLGSTLIKKGVKLDNLIQIAHNVEIGENTVIAGQSAIAGSTKLGKNIMIAGQVGIIGHLKIADDVKIAGQSGVGHSVAKEGEVLQGSPAFGIMDYQKSYVMFRKLPKLNARIDAIEKQLKLISTQGE